MPLSAALQALALLDPATVTGPEGAPALPAAGVARWDAGPAAPRPRPRPVVTTPGYHQYCVWLTQMQSYWHGRPNLLAREDRRRVAAPLGDLAHGRASGRQERALPDAP